MLAASNLRAGRWAASLFFLIVVLSTMAASAEEIVAVDFNRDIAPILAKRCLECHNEREAAGSLVLTSGPSLAAGGDSGSTVDATNPGGSLLLLRVEGGGMPPAVKGQPQPLPENEAKLLRKWVESGAAWPEGRVLDLYESTSDVRAGRDWWSLRAVMRPAIPAFGGPSANPIDAFVLEKLAHEEMSPAPEADRQTLIRRLNFDLWGLPPSAEEIDAFILDEGPLAYERLVDRLLASPRFGQRWARHWLDVARYADTSGYERDQEKPGAWRYRDWVAASFNADKPYDRFVVEQLAGDELPDKSEETTIATGLLRLGTWNDEPNDPEEYKYDRLEDLVHVVGSAFLGMTIKCARCHDHKFDPIPQLDYYRLANAFWPGPIEARERELLGGPSKEELGYDVLGWTDIHRDAPPLHLLKKGDPHRPLEEVAFGPLALTSSSLAVSVEPTAADEKTTGRRRQFAEWIVDPQHPLTARVIVNRLWMHHFGQGLVRSANNFGFTGDEPSHRELLDWLASELVDSGWSLKHVHRLMLNSATYRQASIHPRETEYAQRDFDNRWCWRANRRRLDAEPLRDAMLFVSGELDERIGGPGFRPTVSAEALEGLSRKAAAWTPSPESEQLRRSLYMFSQRSLIAPFLTTFDFCDTTQPCESRQVSTVAPQALTLLNNPFVHERSQALAKRVTKAAGQETTDEKRIELAWRMAYGRSPRPSELALANEHLENQRQRFAPSDRTDDLAFASLCLVLLNSNEFVYVD